MPAVPEVGVTLGVDPGATARTRSQRAGLLLLNANLLPALVLTRAPEVLTEMGVTTGMMIGAMIKKTIACV